MRSIAYTLLILSLLVVSHIHAATIHVPSEQPTIQAGIDVAIAGDTVLVADGVYTGTGNKNLTYNGKAILVISENGPDSTIIDCGNGGRGFMFENSEDSNSVLYGFTIRNGNADLGGGGIRILDASPIISNCIFIDNLSAGVIGGAGGGIACNNSSPIIKNCSFLGNFAGNTQGFTGGGAIYCKDSDPIILNSLFAYNKCHPGGGGAIFCDNSSPVISNCTFFNNPPPSFPYTAGTIWLQYSSSPVIERCIFSFAESTEAIMCADTGSSPVISCSNIFGNVGGDWVNCIADQAGINGNFSADPLFCDTAATNLYLDGASPCAPRNSACENLIGALDVGCNCCLIGGDTDYSGRIDIADLTYFVAFLFGGGPSSPCPEEADIDGSGTVDVSDLTYIVAYLFEGGPAPAGC